MRNSPTQCRPGFNVTFHVIMSNFAIFGISARKIDQQKLYPTRERFKMKICPLNYSKNLHAEINCSCGIKSYEGLKVRLKNKLMR